MNKFKYSKRNIKVGSPAHVSSVSRSVSPGHIWWLVFGLEMATEWEVRTSVRQTNYRKYK